MLVVLQFKEEEKMPKDIQEVIAEMREEVKDAELTEDQKLELGAKIVRYHKYDSEEKAAKKLREPLNLELKKAMAEMNLNLFEFNGYVASYSPQERISMNEDRLIAKLKELGHTDAIVHVEKADTGKLEELIYDGKLDPELLVSCNDTKIVEVLSIKKPKAKVEKKLTPKVGK